MANLPPIPQTDVVATIDDPETGKKRLTGAMEGDWYQFVLALWSRLNKTSERLTRKRLQGLSASIGATALPLGSLSPGTYRVNWRYRKTQAATLTSSLSFTLGWVDGLQPMSRSSTANTVNTTSAEDNGVWFIRIDQSSPVTYGTTYGSTGATPMEYELEVTVELVPS